MRRIGTCRPATRTSTNTSRGRFANAAFVATVLVSLFAGIGTGGIANAAFSDCPSGRACLWPTAVMGTPGWSSASSQGGQFPNEINYAAKSFGNRRSSTCARFYEWQYVGPVGYQSTLHAQASTNTGNSWGGATRTIDQVSFSSGSC